MEIIDEAKLSNALREQKKVEYINFAEQMRKTKEQRNRLRNVKKTVPSSIVSPVTQKMQIKVRSE